MISTKVRRISDFGSLRQLFSLDILVNLSHIIHLSSTKINNQIFKQVNTVSLIIVDIFYHFVDPMPHFPIFVPLSFNISPIFIYLISAMSQSTFLYYDDTIYLQCQHNQYLFSRGFIDNQTHLSLQRTVECEFSFEQKNYQQNSLKVVGKKEIVVFGTEILIRHIYSNQYLSFVEDLDGNERIQLQEKIHQSCFFELLPQRSFQHKGDSITTDSSFSIQHSNTKAYLGSNIFQTDPLKNKIRIELKSSKILQSYHMTRHLSQEKKNSPFKQIDDSIVEEDQVERQPFLKKSIEDRDNLNRQIISKNNLKRQLSRAFEEEIKAEKDIYFPIQKGKNERIALVPCSIEKHAHTMWKAQTKQRNLNPYLQDHDYIYFTSSFKNKGTLTIEQGQDNKYPRYFFTNRLNDNQYECSAIFVVEIEQDEYGNQENVYLKHLISGKYFPFSEHNIKKKLKLLPLLPSSTYQNKLPPFHIYFEGDFFPKELLDYQSVCGFWLNKVDKIEINQILSLQSIPHTKWIPYLTSYLDSDRQKKQQILRQFGFLKHIVFNVLPLIQSQQLYMLLFKMINLNPKNRKQMAEYISQLLKYQNKEYLIDILAEILNSNDNFVEKYINPAHLNHEIDDFKIEDVYSNIYMRIFRLFCGTFMEPCQRNQNLIYRLFFGKSGGQKFISESVFKVDSNQIPQKYKFKLMFNDKKEVLIKNLNSSKPFMDYSLQIQSYLRQYFYLLGDCLKQNKKNVQDFKKTNNYSVNNLLDILQNSQLIDLHGPVINLINVAYLNPQYKYKLYVYIKDYDQMCFKGSLVALQQSQPSKRLLSYIHNQKERIKEQLGQLEQLTDKQRGQRDEKEKGAISREIVKENQRIISYFSSSKFKRFLIMVKHSIQNGYWNNISHLELLVDTLSNLYVKKQEKVFNIHDNYKQGHQQKNYTDSTVLIIDIAILYLDLQINLCISSLLTLDQARVVPEIDEFMNNLHNNKLFQQHFDYFHLTEVQNSQMMQKSLILSRKYYEIKSIILEKYKENKWLRQSQGSLKDSIQLIKGSIQGLKPNDSPSIDICKRYISNCLQGVNLNELTSEQMLVNGCILRPAFSYKRVVSQFQSLAHKLGVLGVLMDCIERYIDLRSRDKKHQKDFIYWKILLLFALIKDNKQLRRQIAPFRQKLIYLLGEQKPNSFLAIDLLQQFYINNRSMIVSDKQQLKQICRLFVSMMIRDHQCEFSSQHFLNIKINKLLNLIYTFLLVDGKIIKMIFPIILNELFDKDVLVTYICKLKNIDNHQLIKTSSQDDQHFGNQDYHVNNSHLFQILLYRLTETLEQKPLKMNFTLPSVRNIMNLIIAIGRHNLALTFDIYNLISEEQIQQEQIFLNVFRGTLHLICQIGFEEFKNQSQDGEKEFSEYSHSLQTILIHMPFLIKIVKVFIEGSRASKQNRWRTTIKRIDYGNEVKLELIQRLFLFNRFLTDRVKQKLIALVRNNLIDLQLETKDIDTLVALDFLNFTITDINNPKNSLIQLSQKLLLKSKQKKLAVKRSSSRWGLRNFKGQELLQLISHISEQNLPIKNNQHFRISKARQFIKSLTFINKQNKNQLDNQLKTFFLSFLINRFPTQPQDILQLEQYRQQLQKQQNLLIDYGSAELVSTLLEQRFTQNYVMFINVFEYGNKLLEGGNEKAQQCFYDIFLKDHTNTIFQNIHTMIEETTMALKFYYHSYPKVAEGPKQLQKEELIYPENNTLEALKERKDYREMLKKIYRFLQLLCQNDNQELKKYIYQQTNEDRVIKYMSINFLEIAINNFSQLIDTVRYNLEYPWIDPEDRNQEVIDDFFSVLQFILDFLIEVCQYPAIKNQLFICNADFFNNIETLNDLSIIYLRNYENLAPILSLQRKVVILLRGLLEQKSKEVIESLAKKLNIEGLVQFVKLSLDSINISTREQLVETMTRNHDKLIEEVDNVVDIIIVCSALDVRLEEKMPSHQGVVEEIRKQIREIQVDFKGKLTTIHFCYRPIFNYLSKDTKQFFIKRFSLHESRNQKLKDVINLRHIINQDIMHRKSRQLIMSETSTNSLFHLSIFLCYVLVALQLFFFSVNRMGTVLDSLETSIIRGIAALQFFTSLLYFVLWGIGVSPITRQKIKQKYNLQNSVSSEKKSLTTLVNQYIILGKEIYFQQDSSLHSVLLVVISAFACFIEVRIYSFVLLYIFAKIQLLRDILSAISVTWRQLILVSLLSMAFNFIFGFLTINYYINILYQNEAIDIGIDHITSHCSTLMGCIDSLYAQRIIGETPSRVGDSSHYGRLFSDSIYWAFFDIVIPNLTAAIIIDKFAWLRNVKEKMENQERNKCLICFADKSTIQRRGELFFEHKSKRHCIWDYFFYLYFLEKLKSNTQYTGVEYWIIKQVKKQEVEWFPLDQSQKQEVGDQRLGQLLGVVRKRAEEDNPLEREHRDL